MTGQRKGRGLVPFDDDRLVQMSEEIAALLVKHVPEGGTVALSGDMVRLRSETRVQIVGSSVKCKAIFSLNVVFRRPPPSGLNVRCFTHNGC